MATIKEEFESLKIRINKGEGGKVIHVVDHSAEKKRKLENPKQSTRIVLNMRTPEAWKEFQTEHERYFEIAIDPHIALGLMIRALRQVKDETLRRWLSEGHQHPDDASAEPDWMRD